MWVGMWVEFLDLVRSIATGGAVGRITRPPTHVYEAGDVNRWIP